MPLALDTSAITHGIQLAVAPVFLLTAVSGMIGVVAGRLARIIDRARVVEERARREPESSEQAVQLQPLLYSVPLTELHPSRSSILTIHSLTEQKELLRSLQKKYRTAK